MNPPEATQPKAPRSTALWLVAGVMLAAGAAWAVLNWDTRKPAPQVEFKTITGERFNTSDLRGKVVLVNFWATSCVGCVHEMPMLVETHRKFAARGFETVAVAMNYDRPDYVVNFTETRGLPFKVAFDADNVLAPAFNGTQVTPTSFVLDKQGRIVKRFVGEPSKEELQALIKRQLAAS